MKLYCGRNRKGVWKASFDEQKIEKFYPMFESEVETFHNNTVYMIRTYYGYDYDFTEGGGISDCYQYVYELFHSVSAAKKHQIWKERERLAKENPEKYHITPFSIASDDSGEPFDYGDAMCGKFNMEIFRVRVI